MSKRKAKAGALETDSRWTDKESKLLLQLDFPEHFKQSVDLRKVQLQVIRPWITARVTELLGIEDDIVCDFATSLLEDPAHNPFPDPRKLQVALLGFLDKHAATLVDELWSLLLSAQQSIGGIPQEFVERKKKELEAQRAAEQAAAAAASAHSHARYQNQDSTRHASSSTTGRRPHPDSYRPGESRRYQGPSRGPQRSPPRRWRDNYEQDRRRNDDRYDYERQEMRRRDDPERERQPVRSYDTRYERFPPRDSPDRERGRDDDKAYERQRNRYRSSRSRSRTPPLRRHRRSASPSRSPSRSPARSPASSPRPRRRNARSRSPSD